MKRYTTLTTVVTLLMTSQALAATKSNIDPAAKEIASMKCRWVLDGGKLTEPAQRLTIYENTTGTWLELQPSDKTNMPPIVYKRRSAGGFVADDKYRELYWKGYTTRLEMLRSGQTATLAIEFIENASLPIVRAKCDDVMYAKSTQ